jgi:signal peptidase II
VDIYPSGDKKNGMNDTVQPTPVEEPKRNILRDYLFLLPIAGLVLALDQYTKALVRASLEVGDIWAPWDWLAPYARIVNAYNTGAAFGILKNFGGVFTVLAIIVAIAILYYFPQIPRSEWALRLALSLQMGGALGNLTDRLVRNYVTDFISVWNFPVFNIADASIFIGVIVLGLGMWKNERGLAMAKPEQGPSDPRGEDPPAGVAHSDPEGESFGA